MIPIDAMNFFVGQKDDAPKNNSPANRPGCPLCQCVHRHKFQPRIGKIRARPDLSEVASVDLCDAASYFTYDAPSEERGTAQRLLVEVFNRGDISRKDYNSALTGDVELGMTDLASTCAWGLPDEEEEYYISGGRKYTRWTYRYGEYGLDRDTLEFVNDRVVAIRAGG